MFFGTSGFWPQKVHSASFCSTFQGSELKRNRIVVLVLLREYEIKRQSHKKRKYTSSPDSLPTDCFAFCRLCA